MRIAHVVSTFYPRFGGMGEVCRQEARRLAAAGHAVTVLTMLYDKKDARAGADFGFKVERLRPLWRYGDAGVLPRLFFKLKGFDVIHLHYPFYAGAHLVYLASVVRGARYVVTYHMDAQTVGLKRWLQNIYDWLWAKKIMRRAARVIVVDKEFGAKSRYGRWCAADKTVEILNGVDTNVFCPLSAERKNNLRQEYGADKLILFVGNPLPLKRLDLAIKALPLLFAADVKLLIAGEGYGLPIYRDLAARLKVDKQIEWLGGIADEKRLVELFNAADVTVAPSDYESFSLTAVCALSCGCPVIASDIAALRGRVSDGVSGLLFKPGSAQDLADKLNYFFALPGRARVALGQAGRQQALARYDWVKHLTRLEEVYRAVVT